MDFRGTNRNIIAHGYSCCRVCLPELPLYSKVSRSAQNLQVYYSVWNSGSWSGVRANAAVRQTEEGDDDGARQRCGTGRVPGRVVRAQAVPGQGTPGQAVPTGSRAKPSRDRDGVSRELPGSLGSLESARMTRMTTFVRIAIIARIATLSLSAPLRESGPGCQEQTRLTGRVAQRAVSSRRSVYTCTRPLSGTWAASVLPAPSLPARLVRHPGWQPSHLPRRGLYEAPPVREGGRRREVQQNSSQGASRDSAGRCCPGWTLLPCGAGITRKSTNSIILLLLLGFPGFPQRGGSQLPQTPARSRAG